MTVKSRALNGGDVEFQNNTGNDRLTVSRYMIPAGSDIARQITGTASGTYVRGPSVSSPDGFMIQGHPANSSYVMYGNSGVPGYPLNPGVSQYLPVENLSDWFLSVNTSGDKIVWSMV